MVSTNSDSPSPLPIVLEINFDKAGNTKGGAASFNTGPPFEKIAKLFLLIKKLPRSSKKRSECYPVNILKILNIFRLVGRTERFSNTHLNNFNNLRAKKARKSPSQT